MFFQRLSKNFSDKKRTFPWEGSIEKNKRDTCAASLKFTFKIKYSRYRLLHKRYLLYVKNRFYYIFPKSSFFF